jgi:CheY-like chemotaxis protein
VKLYFPEVNRPVTPGHIPVITEEPRGDGHVVLLVEDEPAVRTLGMRVLESLGYRVIQAADGPTALKLARRETKIDLLLTDVVLAGPMNGRQLAEELAKERKDLRVLYVSGYSADIVLHRAELDEPLHLLAKPYDRRQLAAAVWAALQR